MTGSPADDAGLKAGDLLVAVGGTPAASSGELQRLMVADAIGKRVEITVWRNGALVDVIAVPGELADAPELGRQVTAPVMAAALVLQAILFALRR